MTPHQKIWIFAMANIGNAFMEVTDPVNVDVVFIEIMVNEFGVLSESNYII